jgi:hypothetical protein
VILNHRFEDQHRSAIKKVPVHIVLEKFIFLMYYTLHGPQSYITND